MESLILKTNYRCITALQQFYTGGPFVVKLLHRLCLRGVNKNRRLHHHRHLFHPWCWLRVRHRHGTQPSQLHPFRNFIKWTKFYDFFFFNSFVISLIKLLSSCVLSRYLCQHNNNNIIIIYAHKWIKKKSKFRHCIFIFYFIIEKSTYWLVSWLWNETTTSHILNFEYENRKLKRRKKKMQLCNV